MQLDPMEIYRRENTPEAQARRRQRRKARGWSQHYPLDRTTDLLAVRERSIQRWKDRAAAEADKPQFGLGRFGWVWRIYHHPGFRRLVLPAVRCSTRTIGRARSDTKRRHTTTIGTAARRKRWTRHATASLHRPGTPWRRPLACGPDSPRRSFSTERDKRSGNRGRPNSQSSTVPWI